jgi:hypothetical protein
MVDGVEIDPRGQRFAATLTSIVLGVVLVTGWGWLALAQTAIFAVTAIDPRRGPYPMIFRVLVRPLLGPPAELEPAAPVRFAQLVGFVFLAIASLGYLTQTVAVGPVFAAFGLLAAFLNAAFGLCLGCELYLTFKRLAH